MPELPEVEILIRHLRPLLEGTKIQRPQVLKPGLMDKISADDCTSAINGAQLTTIDRRGKFILFRFKPHRNKPDLVVSHLGMTGRMFLQPLKAPLPKHAAVTWRCGDDQFVFEDPRGFGSFGFRDDSLKRMGPEPLSEAFTIGHLYKELKRSKRTIKACLMDQSLVTGLGNIYVSESLHRAGIRPTKRGQAITKSAAAALWSAIRETLSEAIELGASLKLDFQGSEKKGDGLFYFGSSIKTPPELEERFLVYGREGSPCSQCGSFIKRITQDNRGSFYCPSCQK